MECDYILGDAVGFPPCVATDSFENAHGGSGESVKALSHMVRMTLGAILKEHLARLRGTRQVLQLA